jgi:hypothetical protein
MTGTTCVRAQTFVRDVARSVSSGVHPTVLHDARTQWHTPTRARESDPQYASPPPSGRACGPCHRSTCRACGRTNPTGTARAINSRRSRQPSPIRPAANHNPSKTQTSGRGRSRSPPLLSAHNGTPQRARVRAIRSTKSLCRLRHVIGGTASASEVLFGPLPSAFGPARAIDGVGRRSSRPSLDIRGVVATLRGTKPTEARVVITTAELLRHRPARSAVVFTLALAMTGPTRARRAVHLCAVGGVGLHPGSRTLPTVTLVGRHLH